MRHEALPFKGSLIMPGEGFNGQSPLNEVAANTAFVNRPRELDKRFWGDDAPTLLRIPVENDGEIRLHNQTGSYTPRGSMIVARGPEYPDKPKDIPITAEQVYDHPPEVQKMYWELLFTALGAYREELGAGPRIFTGGNHLKTYSNYEERTARTIAHVHDHIIIVDKEFEDEYIDGGVEAIEGFQQERDISRRLLPSFINRVRQRWPESNDLQIEQRENLPYGYTFSVSPEMPMTDFAHMMKAHYIAYTEVAQKMKARYDQRLEKIEEDKRSVKYIGSQPSMRTYLEVDDAGTRWVTISPQFLGPVGVMEAAGIQSRRTPDASHHVNPDEELRVRLAVAERLKEVFPNAEVKKLEPTH